MPSCGQCIFNRTTSAGRRIPGVPYPDAPVQKGSIRSQLSQMDRSVRQNRDPHVPVKYTLSTNKWHVFMIKTDLMIRLYPDKTQERKCRLDQYVQENLLASDNTFICSRFQECSDSRKEFWFYKGQMSHVGKHYDLEVDGRPMRIVLVGQEYGQACTCVDFCERPAMIATSAQGGFKQRNPHMRGV